MGETVISVQGLQKTYAGRAVLSGFSLEAESGTLVGLLGPNGAGKSTAIECMLGTRRADAGTVRVLGHNPEKREKALLAQVGVQFQQGDYQSEIKVYELCEETACLYAHPDDWRALLARFGMGHLSRQPVKRLSGGERQRLFIVLALIPRPRVVFLDELTTGLDVKARKTVWSALKTLKEQGLTILLTSHFMDEVEALCDRIYILREGICVFSGTCAQAMECCGVSRLEDAYLALSGEGEGA